MKSKRQASKGKKINPHFWVFCEGETEEAYIRFLRSEYRLPVEIIQKLLVLVLTSVLLPLIKKENPFTKKTRIF